MHQAKALDLSACAVQSDLGATTPEFIVAFSRERERERERESETFFPDLRPRGMYSGTEPYFK